MYKVITQVPLTIEQMISITGKDALMIIDGYKTRYMMYTENQEIDEVDMIKVHKGYKFALKKTKKTNNRYEYISFVCKDERKING